MIPPPLVGGGRGRGRGSCHDALSFASRSLANVPPLNRFTPNVLDGGFERREACRISAQSIGDSHWKGALGRTETRRVTSRWLRAPVSSLTLSRLRRDWVVAKKWVLKRPQPSTSRISGRSNPRNLWSMHLLPYGTGRSVDGYERTLRASVGHVRLRASTGRFPRARNGSGTDPTRRSPSPIRGV